MEKYLPWYGAAGLGMVGHEAGKLLPKKLQMLGRIGGTLAGTALGVHGGEAVGKKLDQRQLRKQADYGDENGGNTPAPKNRVKEVAKTVGKGLAGMSAGTLAGYGAGKAVEHGARAVGKPVSKAALVRYGIPAAGAGLGTAYSLWKAREAQELKSALEGTRDSGK